MIFWDLDGPILDVSEKYYRVYYDILKESNSETLTKEDYWEAKRNKIQEEEILLSTNVTIPYIDYCDKRMVLIETNYYLAYDSLQYYADTVLENFAREVQLVLVTLRRSESQLHRELEYFKIKNCFTAILSSSAQVEPRWKIKYDLIKKYMGQDQSNNHLLIGDTETDIEAGKHLGFTTIAISNGIRHEQILQQSNPDYIYSSISDFYNHHVMEEIL